MSVDVETFTTSGLNFVKLRGSLTSGMSLSTAEAKIKSVIEGGAKRLVLDISLITYSDSSGLGMLVQAFGFAEKANCKLRIAGANEKLRALMNTTRLDTILALDPDAETSLAKLIDSSASGSAV